MSDLLVQAKRSQHWQWFRWAGGVLGAVLGLLLLTHRPNVQAQSANIWYVRVDGGSPQQCTGRVDAPYPGSGLNQPCAWDHPFRALPPGQTPRLVGGDTLIIGPGSYRMGLGAPETTVAVCASAWAYDCYMPPIPSGPDRDHPTRIVGKGWNANTQSCTSPPQLWGTEEAEQIINLTASRNVELACLEITDHAGCVKAHSNPAFTCRESYPSGDWAKNGLYAEDSANVTLRYLNIHGLAHAGIHAGRLNNWTLAQVRIAGNGWAGWHGELPVGHSRNQGRLHFKGWTVEWNGCAESYPGQQPSGCWSQTAGGYGDGVGTGATGGDWLIEDSIFRYNTSDGLDLLYVDQGSIVVRRSLFQGNAGNQLKTKGNARIENSVVVGNCGYFTGQPFTDHVDPCRAGGNALSVTLRNGEQAAVTNATLASAGDCLVVAECSNCTGNERITLHNNIFQGYPDVTAGGSENSCLVYEETFLNSPFVIDYSVINGVKHDACPGSVARCNQGAGLQNLDLNHFDARLLASSPAINRGNPSSAPPDDFTGQNRDQQPDIGAYEYGSGTNTPTPTPTATSTPIPTVTPTSTPSSTTGAIQGRVTAADGTPLTGIRVTAYLHQGDRLRQTAYATTGANGRYLLNRLPPGDYHLGFRDPAKRYQAEYYHNITRLQNGTDVPVVAGAVVNNIDADLARVARAKAQVRGLVAHTVDEESGEALIVAWPGSRVTLQATLPCTQTGTTITDPILVAGLLTFPLTPMATNSADHQVTLSVPDALLPGDVYPLALEWRCAPPAGEALRNDGQPATEVVETIGELYANRTAPAGQVRDARTGEPIRDATVALYKAGDSCAALAEQPAEWLGLAVEEGESAVAPVVASQQTGDDGAYDWRIADGCWYVEATAPGYQPAVSALFDVGSMPTTVQLHPTHIIFLPTVLR